MAGLGWKQWVRERLSQTDLQGYIQDQVVMRFPSAAARTAELPAPTQGMVSYLDDAGRWEGHDGGGWDYLAGPTPRYMVAQLPSSPAEVPYNQASGLISLMGLMWANALPGDYEITAVLAQKGTVAMGGNMQILANGVVITRPQQRADVGTIVTATTVPVLYTHAGGNLGAEVKVQVAGTGDVAVFSDSTYLTVKYLGARS